MSDPQSMVPEVLKEELTEDEKEKLQNNFVTDFEKRQAIRSQLRAESRQTEKTLPIGSSDSPTNLIDRFRGVIPNLGVNGGVEKDQPSSSTSSSYGALAGLKDVPDLLEDIRESMARIQDRSYLLDQKFEYPPRAPPVEVEVADGELCSRKYGFCRTIPMILADIAYHVRTISTVPSRQQLLKDVEEGRTASPFFKSTEAQPPAPYAGRSGPGGPAAGRFGTGGVYPGRFAPGGVYPGRFGPNPGRPGERAPYQGVMTSPPIDEAKIPKSNSVPPEIVLDRNTNDDPGDGLETDDDDDDDDDEKPEPDTKRVNVNQSGGDPNSEKWDDFDYKDSAEMPDYMLDADAGGRLPGASTSTVGPGDDGFYKIVNIVPPSYNSIGGQ